MPNPWRKTTPASIVLILGLLMGVIVFWRNVPDASPQPEHGAAPPRPAEKTTQSAGPSPYRMPEPDFHPLAPRDQLDTTASPATEEASLPPLPTGDYELNLTGEQIDVIVETHYGRLFQTLHLSPGRQARLRALLVERQQASVDAVNSALLTGLNPIRDLPTITRAIELTQAEADDRVRNELGLAVLAACREYDHTLPLRNSVDDFARQLAAVREPLLPEQENQLMHIMANLPDTEAAPDLGRAIFGGTSARAPIGTEAFRAAAKILSPRQLAVLRESQAAGMREGAPP